MKVDDAVYVLDREQEFKVEVVQEVLREALLSYINNEGHSKILGWVGFDDITLKSNS
jgi:hypothetical protein